MHGNPSKDLTWFYLSNFAWDKLKVKCHGKHRLMMKKNIIEKSMHTNPKMVVWCSIELRAQVKATNLKKENQAIFFSITFKTTLFSLPTSDHGRMFLTYHEGNVLLKIVLFRFMSLWSTIWARTGFKARWLSPSSRLAHSCTIFLCPLEL